MKASFSFRAAAVALAAILAAAPTGAAPAGSRPAAPDDPLHAPVTVAARVMLPGPLAADGVPRRIVLTAVGDVSLAREVNDRMAVHGPDYPFELVTTLLTGDIVVGNLEGALTVGGDRWPKAFTFRSPPALAGGLANAGFDVMALANNHAMDFGATGLLDTIATLDALGIRSVGAGRTREAAQAPVIVSREGMSVAIVSYVLTPDEWTGFSICSWDAGAESPGLAVASTARLVSTVRAAAGVADFVVVLLHAGTEYAASPDSTQVTLAAAAVGAGAHAVIGSHPHTVQPVSWGGPGTPLIAWSLGNFVFDLDEFDLAGIPVPRVSPVLRLVLGEEEGVVGWDALAVVQDVAEDRPRPATPSEATVLHGVLSADRAPVGAPQPCEADSVP